MNGKEPELKFPVRCALRIIFEGDEAPVLAAAQMILARYRMPEVWEPGRASSGGTWERGQSVTFTVIRPTRSIESSSGSTDGSEKIQALSPFTRMSPSHSRRMPRARTAPR